MLWAVNWDFAFKEALRLARERRFVPTLKIANHKPPGETARNLFQEDKKKILISAATNSFEILNQNGHSVDFIYRAPSLPREKPLPEEPAQRTHVKNPCKVILARFSCATLAVRQPAKSGVVEVDSLTGGLSVLGPQPGQRRRRLGRFD
jgi:hypothetical protein